MGAKPFPAAATMLAIAVNLAGCVHRAGDDAGCCSQPERYPPLLVALGEPIAPLVGHALGSVTLRPGHLSRTPGAIPYIEERLRPLDVVVVSSKGRLSGRAVPGLFSHAALYVGSEAELRGLGVWNDPAVKPHQAAIRAGKNMIEADRKGVHLSAPETALDTDRAVVLRPRLSEKRRRAAAIGLLSHVGSRFDFHFDNAEDAYLYCVELAMHVMPEIGIPADRLYGRMTYLPDRLAATGTAGTGGTRFVLYVRTDRSDWETASARALHADLDAAWGR